MLKIILLTATLSVMLPARTSTNPKALSVIEGTVTNEEKQPLQKVHSYTVLGEEETFTNDKGEFSFKTYQPFPLKLIVEGKDYEKKTIELVAPPDKLSIVLTRK